MSKVIDIEDRIKLEQKKKAKVDQAKKLEAVRKVVQCTAVARPLVPSAGSSSRPTKCTSSKKVPQPCPFCREEYEDFLPD